MTLLSQCCSFPSHTGCVSTEEDSKLTCPLPIKEPNTCCCFLSQKKRVSSSTPPYISITSQIILPLKQPFQPLIFLPEPIWNMRLKQKHAAGGERSLARVKMKPRGLLCLSGFMTSAPVVSYHQRCVFEDHTRTTLSPPPPTG